MLSGVLIVPFWEEAVFRGVLLQRFTLKWGPWPALLISSFFFAIFHADVLGAFVFGIVMGLLYVSTGSLWVPIVCHALNNAMAFALELVSLYRVEYSVEEFQGEWFVGLACLLVGGIGLWAMRRWYIPASPLQFPQPAPVALPALAGKN